MTSARTFWRSSGGWGYLFFVVTAVLPMAASLAYALAYSVGLAGLLGRGFTTEYWARAFAAGEIPASFALSLWVAVVVILVAIALGLALGLYLRRAINTGPLSNLLYLLLALPGIVLGFIAFQVLTGAGLAARVAAALGLVEQPAQFPNLVNDPLGIGIILAQLLVTVPFFAILFARLYESERVGELEMLAATLGASQRTRLVRVTVPVLLRRAFPTIVLTLVALLGAYEVPLLLGSQSPQMISVLTMRKYAAFDLGRKPEAFICAILYTAVALVLVSIAYHRGRRLDG